MRTIASALAAMCLVLVGAQAASGHSGFVSEWPEVPMSGVTIDGDLSEWKDLASNDGVWDLPRVLAQPWLGEGSELTDSGLEPVGTAGTTDDWSAEYFMAWNNDGLLLGAEVTDNYHDIVGEGSHHYRDDVSWWMDVQHTGGGEESSWSVIVFFADPDGLSEYQPWLVLGSLGWQRGELLPKGILWKSTLDPITGTNYTIEAFMPFDTTFNVVYSFWVPPFLGRTIGFNIVNPDPDGQETFGGQVLHMYGGGIDQAMFADGVLVEGVAPVAVEATSWSNVKQLFR